VIVKLTTTKMALKAFQTNTHKNVVKPKAGRNKYYKKMTARKARYTPATELPDFKYKGWI